MKKILLSLLAFTALTSVTSVVQASPKCTDETQEKWLSEDAMKQKISEMGYEKIKVFKKTMSGCYEIYGYTKDGKKAEVYFNPIDGSVVEKNIDGEYGTSATPSEKNEIKGEEREDD
jgi:hypothetical protein